MPWRLQDCEIAWRYAKGPFPICLRVTMRPVRPLDTEVSLQRVGIETAHCGVCVCLCATVSKKSIPWSNPTSNSGRVDSPPQPWKPESSRSYPGFYEVSMYHHAIPSYPKRKNNLMKMGESREIDVLGWKHPIHFHRARKGPTLKLIHYPSLELTLLHSTCPYKHGWMDSILVHAVYK